MTKDIKLAVVGSRSFDNQKLCWKIINQLKEDNDWNITKIISGAARGADAFGEAYSDYYKIEKLIFPAEWKKYGKRAGYIRNVDIIKNCDVCVAFHDEISRGTQHDRNLCKEYNKECWVYNFLTNELYKDN